MTSPTPPSPQDAARRQWRESQARNFWASFPTYFAVITLAIVAVLTLKTCESPNARYDEDRTGIKGMPY